jgi:hypothetical protein
MPGPDDRRVLRTADELHPTHIHDHPRQPLADARRFKRKSPNQREKVHWRKLKQAKDLPLAAKEHRLEAYATLGFRNAERLSKTSRQLPQSTRSDGVNGVN